MKLTTISKIGLFFLFLIIFSSCRKAGEEIMEKVGKTISKETVETSIETGAKFVTKSLTKKEIEFTLIKNGCNKNVVKNVVKHLSNKEASLLVSELKMNNANMLKFNKNPDLVQAYQKLFKSESYRSNINYLNQTENWIKNGSQGELIIKIQSSNVEKKLLNTVQNDIPFIKKIIKNEGITLSGVFPDFRKYTIYKAPELENVFLKSSDKTQFSISRANLRKEYEKSSSKIEDLLMAQNKRFAENGGIFSKSAGRYITDPQEMLEIQIKDIIQIKSGNQQERIFGFVWHHNESNGIIDLVAYDKHNSVKHIGGRNIWAGGSIARK